MTQRNLELNICLKIYYFRYILDDNKFNYSQNLFVSNIFLSIIQFISAQIQ